VGIILIGTVFAALAHDSIISLGNLTLLKTDHTYNIYVTVSELAIVSTLMALNRWGRIHFYCSTAYSGRFSSR
jgi:hypothetical protein